MGWQLLPQPRGALFRRVKRRGVGEEMKDRSRRVADVG